MSDDELCAWWAAEGGTSDEKRAHLNFEYITQDDRDFVRLVCRELRRRGYGCKVHMVKPGSYAARADHASAYKFIKDVILPRREKIPRYRYKKALGSLRRLERTMSRGLGRDAKSRFR